LYIFYLLPRLKQTILIRVCSKNSLKNIKKIVSMKNLSYLCLFSLIVLISTQTVLAQKKMFRWTDENDNVFFSDQVPPDQVQHKRDSLNENARVLDTLEKQKTKEQQALAKRLAKLRKQQEKIIQKHKSHDKVLLSTFRTIEDMKLSLKAKTLTLDSQRRVIKSNLERIEKQLQQQQKRAAQYERDGKKVPAKILTDIEANKLQLEQAFIEVSRQFDKKKQIRESFEADITRFLFLTQSSTGSNERSHKTAEIKAANELGLFVCESNEQCNAAWEAAKIFVKDNSITALDIETDKLIMSLPPMADDQLSLSISKLKMKTNRQQLFLDIRCYKSSLGEDLCRGEKAKKIRHSFSDYIKSALPTKQ
jgi:hypothetical protein